MKFLFSDADWIFITTIHFQYTSVLGMYDSDLKFKSLIFGHLGCVSTPFSLCSWPAETLFVVFSNAGLLCGVVDQSCFISDSNPSGTACSVCSLSSFLTVHALLVQCHFGKLCSAFWSVYFTSLRFGVHHHCFLFSGSCRWNSSGLHVHVAQGQHR